MNPVNDRFTAILLAGDREAENPVAEAAGVSCKVLAPVNGTPMILRVVKSLERAGYVKKIIMCGPDRETFMHSPVLRDLKDSGRVEWLAARATPSASAGYAMESVPKEMRVLLTTGDHALLSPKVIDFFCRSSLDSGCDATAALAPLQEVAAAFPETRRTSYRLKDGAYCSCNLFSFLTPDAGKAVLFWRRIEEKRKNPLKVVTAFGWTAVLQYLTGRLTLSAGMELMSGSLGCRACAVIMPFPEAAVDVDTPEDLEYVTRIASAKTAV